MALPVVIPNTFANANASIPLSQLDNNFSTVAVAINGMANGAEALSNVNITGGSIANASLSNVSISSGNVTINVANVTTLDATNIEVTNIKAKDGTASATIADSTGVMTIGSSVLTTADINGGTIDATAIGGSTPAAGAFTTLSATGKITASTAAGVGGYALGRRDTGSVAWEWYSAAGNLQLYSFGAVADVFTINANTAANTIAISSTGLAVTGNLTVSGNTTLGDDSADTLTVNAAVWTLGNFIATSSLGALPTGTTFGPAFVQTLTGHAGGGTIYRGNRQTVTLLASANNTTEVNTNFVSLNNATTGTVNLADVFSGFYNGTAAGTVTSLLMFNARAPGLSGGSLVTNWAGFHVSNPTSASITNARGIYIPAMTGPTVSRAIQCSVANAAGAHNLYIDGTAYNYLLANTGVGSLPLDNAKLYTSLSATLPASPEYAVYGNVAVNNTSGSNGKYSGYFNVSTGVSYAGTSPLYSVMAASTVGHAVTVPTVAAYVTSMNITAAATVNGVVGFFYNPVVNSGGATVTINTGIEISAQTVGTTIYGLRSRIAYAASRWNLYVDGTADNAFAGFTSFGKLVNPLCAVDTTSFATNIVTNTGATYTVLTSDHTIIQTTAASTYTLPAAGSYTGRILHIVTQFAGTVISASSNVVPLAGGAAGTAILAATAGKFAVLQSNGTNWVIIEAN